MANDDFAKVVQMYDDAAEEYARNRIGRESKEDIDRFVKMLKPGAKVLDVGCAAGRDARIFKDKGFDAVGVDLSGKLLAIARSSHPGINFVQANMLELPFEDDSVDGIWSSGVIHHLPRERMPQALAEFARVLKDGGVVYIVTKMGQGTMTTKEERVQNAEREFTLLMPEELKKLLVGAGFRDAQADTRKSKTRELYWVNGFGRKS